MEKPNKWGVRIMDYESIIRDVNQELPPPSVFVLLPLYPEPHSCLPSLPNLFVLYILDFPCHTHSPHHCIFKYLIIVYIRTTRFGQALSRRGRRRSRRSKSASLKISSPMSECADCLSCSAPPPSRSLMMLSEPLSSHRLACFIGFAVYFYRV